MNQVGRSPPPTTTISSEASNSYKLSASSYQLADKIRFLGLKAQEEIKKLYSEASVFVAPSVTANNGDRDGIPNVILEALALGVPVISTNISGIPEIIEHWNTGLLVQQRNELELVNEIERLLLDRDLYLKLSNNGRQRVARKFNITKNIEELIGIYTKEGILN